VTPEVEFSSAAPETWARWSSEEVCERCFGPYEALDVVCGGPEQRMRSEFSGIWAESREGEWDDGCKPVREIN
jgi:hypothetical protein